MRLSQSFLKLTAVVSTVIFLSSPLFAATPQLSPSAKKPAAAAPAKPTFQARPSAPVSTAKPTMNKITKSVVAKPSEALQKEMERKAIIAELDKALSVKGEIVQAIYKEKEKIHDSDMERLATWIMEKMPKRDPYQDKSAVNTEWKNVPKVESQKFEKPGDDLYNKPYKNKINIPSTSVGVTSSMGIVEAEETFQWTKSTPELNALTSKLRNANIAIEPLFTKLGKYISSSIPVENARMMLRHMLWKMMDASVFETELYELRTKAECKMQPFYVPIYGYLISGLSNSPLKASLMMDNLYEFYQISTCISARQLLYVEKKVQDALLGAVKWERLAMNWQPPTRDTSKSSTKAALGIGFIEKFVKDLKDSLVKNFSLVEVEPVDIRPDNVNKFDSYADEATELVYSLMLNLATGFLGRNSYLFSVWQSFLCDISPLLKFWKPGDPGFDFGLWSYDMGDGELKYVPLKEANGAVTCKSVYKALSDETYTSWGLPRAEVFSICEDPIVGVDSYQELETPAPINYFMGNELSPTNIGLGHLSPKEMGLNQFGDICLGDGDGVISEGGGDISCSSSSSGSNNVLCSLGGVGGHGGGNPASSMAGGGLGGFDLPVKANNIQTTKLCNKLMAGAEGGGEDGGEPAPTPETGEEQEEETDDQESDKKDDEDEDGDDIDDADSFENQTAQMTKEEQTANVENGGNEAKATLAKISGGDNPSQTSDLAIGINAFIKKDDISKAQFEQVVAVTGEKCLSKNIVIEQGPLVDSEGKSVAAQYDPTDGKIHLSFTAVGSKDLGYIILHEALHAGFMEGLKTTDPGVEHMMMDTSGPYVKVAGEISFASKSKGEMQQTKHFDDGGGGGSGDGSSGGGMGSGKTNLDYDPLNDDSDSDALNKYNSPPKTPWGTPNPGDITSSCTADNARTGMAGFLCEGKSKKSKKYGGSVPGDPGGGDPVNPNSYNSANSGQKSGMTVDGGGGGGICPDDAPGCNFGGSSMGVTCGGGGGVVGGMPMLPICKLSDLCFGPLFLVNSLISNPGAMSKLPMFMQKSLKDKK